MYLSQIVPVAPVAGGGMEQQPPVIHTNFISRSLYISQMAKCICLKWQNIFVSKYKIYLSRIVPVAPVAGGGVEQQPPVIHTNSISRSLTPIRSMTLHCI